MASKIVQKSPKTWIHLYTKRKRGDVGRLMADCSHPVFNQFELLKSGGATESLWTNVFLKCPSFQKPWPYSKKWPIHDYWPDSLFYYILPLLLYSVFLLDLILLCPHCVPVVFMQCCVFVWHCLYLLLLLMLVGLQWDSFYSTLFYSTKAYLFSRSSAHSHLLFSSSSCGAF